MHADKRSYTDAESFMGHALAKSMGLEAEPTHEWCEWDFVLRDKLGGVVGIAETQTRNQELARLTKPVWINHVKLQRCRQEAARIGCHFYYIQAQTKGVPVRQAPWLCLRNPPPQPLLAYYTRRVGSGRRIVQGSITHGSATPRPIAAIDAGDLRIECKESFPLCMFGVYHPLNPTEQQKCHT